MTRDQWEGIAWIFVGTIMIFAGVRTACSGEITYCSHHYGSVLNKRDKSDWVYRIVDGEKCWFPANGLKRGREKPLEELKWPSKEIPAMKPIGEFEKRWQWIDPTGWTHGE